MNLTATRSRLVLLPGGERGRLRSPSAWGTGAPPASPAARPVTLEVSLLGADARAELEGLEELPGKVHYLRGPSPERWRRDLRTFRSVRAREVYPGIDVVYHGRRGELEYDFEVAPHVSPSRIRMAFSGADRVWVDLQGCLRLETPLGAVVHRRPQLYQEIGGARRPVDGAFVIAEPGAGASPEASTVVGFRVGDYDARKPLVIDPVLAYSSYLGGSAQDSTFASGDVAVDNEGYIYVTGLTASSDFPIERAHQPVNRGGPYSGYDAFLTKLTPDGSAIVYSTYFGGSEVERGMQIGLTTSGRAVLVGSTASSNFPTTAGALKRTLSGSYDIFVTEFSEDGSSLIFSTLLGGQQREWAQDLAVGPDGYLYITGETESPDYPTTPGAFQSTQASFFFDAFLTKMAPDGTSLAYSTYVGGNSHDHVTGVAVAADGEAVICGFTSSNNFPMWNPLQGTFQGGFPGSLDGFVTRFAADGTLRYSTYLAGAADDACIAVALDTQGNTLVLGGTASSNFPTTPGAFDTLQDYGRDGFVAKLDPGGTQLLFSTRVGGSGNDDMNALALDADDQVWIAGTTSSQNFPLQLPLQSQPAGETDGCVVNLSASGSNLLFSTYLGGSGADGAQGLALGPDRSVWVIGSTASGDFPISAALQSGYGGGAEDVFLARYGSLPGAPSGLRLVGSSATSVQLAWTDNSDSETGFRVERRGGGQANFTVVGVVSSLATFLDSGLTPETTYVYRVQAFNLSGGSAYSNPVEVTTAPGTFSLSGRVREFGAGVPGITVMVGSLTATTDAEGRFEVTGLATGSYTVTASAAEFTFVPSSFTVTLGPSQSVEFEATRKTYTISGRVSERGVGTSGVLVRASGVFTATDSSGNYTLSGLPAGAHDVIPHKADAQLTPAFRTVTVGPSASNVDFASNSGPYLEWITTSFGFVRSKKKMTGTVSLNRATVQNAMLRVVSSNPAVLPSPPPIKIRKGRTTATFTVKAKRVTAEVPVELSATFGGVTQRTTLMVTP